MAEALLSKRNTFILKGGGILLMLIHHLFYTAESRELYDDFIIHGFGVINQIGIFCKLCVTVFVFVSGYGLAVSTQKDIRLKDFYFRRFKKLYFNYWFIWVLFVPVTVYLFGRSFAVAYGDHIEVKATLDFFGLLKMFEYDSYNPTWWFYNCIIVLYFLFPFLNKWLWRTPYLVICIAVVIGLLGFVPGVNVIANYLFAFVMGMLISRIPISWVSGMKIWHLLLALVLLSIWKLTKASPKHITEALICVGLALLVLKLPLRNWQGRIFEELGKHSMNMFLIHTFIYWFWFRRYIYITKNPLLIFVSLLITTFLLSVAIEWIKRKIGFYKLLKF